MNERHVNSLFESVFGSHNLEETKNQVFEKIKNSRNNNLNLTGNTTFAVFLELYNYDL